MKLVALAALILIGAGCAGGLTEADVDARIDAAVAAAIGELPAPPTPAPTATPQATATPVHSLITEGDVETRVNAAMATAIAHGEADADSRVSRAVADVVAGYPTPLPTATPITIPPTPTPFGLPPTPTPVTFPPTATPQPLGGALPNVIRAESFQVVDERGFVRAEFGMFLGTPELYMYDSAGKSRITISVLDDQPTIMLRDGSGLNSVLRLGVDSDGSGGMYLRDASGTIRAGLLVLSNGSPDLVLSDAARISRVTLTVLPDGRPIVALAGC